jgi:hypothetical protein
LTPVQKTAGRPRAPQQTVGVFLCEKRQNNPEQHVVDQVIADLDAPDIHQVTGYRLQVTGYRLGKIKKTTLGAKLASVVF